MSNNQLIINVTFNPPIIKIVGPCKETTIEKLNSILPRSTTSLRSSRAGVPKFTYSAAPHSHWTVKLDGQFCDQLGESVLFLTILDAIEEEGGWKLVTTQSITQADTESLQQEYFECHKFFFNRII